MIPNQSSFNKLRGFSLIELLIALAIGLLLLAGLTVVFVNSSEANRELQKTSQQIENGRFAIDTLTQNLHHAGYYGHLYTMPAAPALPDPCNVDASDAAKRGVLFSALAFPVQGYRAPDMVTIADVTATTCDSSLLTSANLQPGSDVLVIRRANTKALAVGDTAVTNDVYIQSIGIEGEVQIGGGAAYVAGTKADGGASTLFLKNGTTAAPIRKYMVHVYFVAPCSVGSGTNAVCTSTDDTIPTLKRLELVSEGGATKMKIVPLVEGIEYMKIEYGIDTLPAAVNPTTQLTGDATVDSYTATPGDWTSVIAAKVFLLARNTEATGFHTDTKSYTLGTAAVAAKNDRYKRHVYSAAVRLVNPAGRREIP